MQAAFAVICRKAVKSATSMIQLFVLIIDIGIKFNMFQLKIHKLST